MQPSNAHGPQALKQVQFQRPMPAHFPTRAAPIRASQPQSRVEVREGYRVLVGAPVPGDWDAGGPYQLSFQSDLCPFPATEFGRGRLHVFGDSLDRGSRATKAKVIEGIGAKQQF